MKINKWLIAIALTLAFILRFWSVGTNPPGLTPDEAALGYNAYSILKTGRDEFGTKLPIIFKSFGDYKPGAYVYLDIPFVAAFGLNEVSTRLPSVIAGVLTVFLIYLITRELFKSMENGRWPVPEWVKIENIAALVAASNPWLIYFSRGAWEANVSLCLTLFWNLLLFKILAKIKIFDSLGDLFCANFNNLSRSKTVISNSFINLTGCLLERFLEN